MFKRNPSAALAGIAGFLVSNLHTLFQREAAYNGQPVDMLLNVSARGRLALEPLEFETRVGIKGRTHIVRGIYALQNPKTAQEIGRESVWVDGKEKAEGHVDLSLDFLKRTASLSFSWLNADSKFDRDKLVITFRLTLAQVLSAFVAQTLTGGR